MGKLNERAQISGGVIVGATLSGCTLNGDDLTAPAVLSGGSATAQPLRVKLKWTNPTVQDFSHVEIYRHTANDSSAASVIAQVRADTFRDTDGVIGTTYYYWGKTVDVNGNKSAFADIGNAAPAAVALASQVSGAGTAATENVGTSGATVPRLNGTNTWSAANFFNGRIGVVNLLALSEGFKTIASGVISAPTSPLVYVAGEGGAADDLVTMTSSGVDGHLVVIARDPDGGDTITVKDATGTFRLAGDCALASNNDRLTVLLDGEGLWVEICRAING
jgi:hypothetical protein